MRIQQLANHFVKQIFKLTIASSLLIPLVVTANSKEACACSCLPPGPPKSELDRSEAVFAGKVMRIRRKNSEVRVKFKVMTSWKGEVNKKQVITTQINSAACGYSFERGQQYLVYASKFDNKLLSTNICSRTKLLANAEEDLSELGEGSPVKGKLRKTETGDD
ncbi:hypothetical protein [Mastigocoleus testarum]|uniref:Tissue inhibitor of metalloproteinase n=1 Tax=Mastigocoleus testarum BC008 TaxID=371196 RepID=A0A0V7ZUY6_9CYAN|nr:hypothetical protein [Mastigocoleus testarum]KST68183.1 hypothetical protein BC008_32705 [Mastigocoleus testarum BC008]KST68846.1 hypothetical protein BC008_34390 [Mastigocoleus testarum BC008]